MRFANQLNMLNLTNNNNLLRLPQLLDKIQIGHENLIVCRKER